MKNFFRWSLLVLAITCGGNAAATDVPLGPGDVIKIAVFGNPDLALETRVSEAGTITYPLVGEVALGDLTTAAAEKKIADLLSNGGFIRDPQVNILVTTLMSRQVSILGQVSKPGRYVLDGNRSITDVIALAGGMTPDGGETVTLIRTVDGKTTRQVIDLYAMSHSGDLAQNVEIANGDIVDVERAPRFYIYGEVQHPGVYRLERGMTVLQALSVGGGLTVRGSERGILIKRSTSEGQLSVIDVKQGTRVQMDDIVYVQESWF